jgi:hypothetical protein
MRFNNNGLLKNSKDNKKIRNKMLNLNSIGVMPKPYNKSIKNKMMNSKVNKSKTKAKSLKPQTEKEEPTYNSYKIKSS